MKTRIARILKLNLIIIILNQDIQKKLRMIRLLKNHLIEERKVNFLYSMMKKIRMKTIMKKLKVIILVKEFL